MIGNKRVLAVVPARGGSKGIPLKNLRPIGGVPMVARVGHVLRDIPLIDRAVVSTDHEEIARVAEQSGLAAPFRRPATLSGDRIGDIDVLTHALNEMEKIDGVTYGIVVMLQPTSPLRRASHVTECIEMLIGGDWDAVWSVSETDSKEHPLKQLTVANSAIDYYDMAGASIIARQQLAPVYHRNGICYAMTRACILEQKTIKGQSTGALVLKGNFVSIDTEWDLNLVEFILSRQDQPQDGDAG
jgi:CMP-N,N'-diacetyllegionaminic acid synthase